MKRDTRAAVLERNPKKESTLASERRKKGLLRRSPKKESILARLLSISPRKRSYSPRKPMLVVPRKRPIEHNEYSFFSTGSRKVFADRARTPQMCYANRL